MVPALGLASYRFAVARLAREMLSIYLGQRTGQRVLAGDIRRGEGQAIEAAILVADLRGFTAMTEREDAFAVVGWVDEHLEAVVDSVADRGGEILKFLGDGVLAVFPAGEAEALPSDACDRALAAAEDALARNAALNRRRIERGAPALDLDVVLHYGDVVYGNVGAARRLDFTVIGRAVNEASRMEALCDDLERHLLVSSVFAGHCSRGTTSLGAFALRGIEGLREIYAPSIVGAAS
jgi:adenylate cyclase